VGRGPEMAFRCCPAPRRGTNITRSSESRRTGRAEACSPAAKRQEGLSYLASFFEKEASLPQRKDGALRADYNNELATRPAAIAVKIKCKMSTPKLETTSSKLALSLFASLCVVALILDGEREPAPRVVRAHTPAFARADAPAPSALVFDRTREAAARARLVAALASPADAGTGPSAGDPFEDVVVSLVLPEEDVHRSDGHGQDDKFFARRVLAEGCIVYAAGLAGSVRFEAAVASETGCSVHAFDCTLTAAAPEWTFLSFHDWCLGQERSFENNVYSRSKVAAGSPFVFKSLADARHELGHSQIDMLKVDIEGFEWDLFESSLLAEAGDANLPQQLLFELHTTGAKPDVPQSLLVNRSKAAVDRLFLRLFDLGYRVMNKELNDYDSRCAEFAMLRVTPAAVTPGALR
jgi:hypothetical protein